MTGPDYDWRWRLTTAAMGTVALGFAGVGLRFSNLPNVVALPAVLPGVLLVGAAIAPRATLPGWGGERRGAWSVLAGVTIALFWTVFSAFALWLMWQAEGWWVAVSAILAAVALSKLVVTVRRELKPLVEPDTEDET